jgi:hypothetical protein
MSRWWRDDDHAGLRGAPDRRAAMLQISPGEIATIESIEFNPGDAPRGRLRLRIAAGSLTLGIDSVRFERAGARPDDGTIAGDDLNASNDE